VAKVQRYCMEINLNISLIYWTLLTTNSQGVFQSYWILVRYQQTTCSMCESLLRSRGMGRW
jgi:hypothetical protein